VLLLVQELLLLNGYLRRYKLKNSIMGRGDKKTAKGKRFQGSFGKSRPANKPSPAKKAAAAKKKA
jgi:30S ribosomal protein S31